MIAERFSELAKLLVESRSSQPSSYLTEPKTLNRFLTIAYTLLGAATLSGAAAQPGRITLKIEPRGSIEGTAKWDWWQARTAFVPGADPFWITTMSETGKRVSHDFHNVYQSLSNDGGMTWSQPLLIKSLGRMQQPDQFDVAPRNLWPTWHAKSGKVLTTGKTFNFAQGKHEKHLREKVSYAENNQRGDLPNGEILLPVRYGADVEKHNYTSTVARCRFDGETLTYLEHGTEMNVPHGRGLYEPSLTEPDGRYFLPLRGDHSAYVSSSKAGLKFDPVREWTFDDGKPLGSYSTQQHWVTCAGGLFLVYTRRGANNDHMFRHRAPLFIKQVNLDTLQVIQATERILIAENHATLGNSGVCRISDHESWVTCGEGLMRPGKRKGQRNKVHHVKITTQPGA